ncbi:hypothetical protein [Sphingomonas sp. Leaf25]|uniref:hypothetical protein n=1 Tax=Sphingomonas sp. Leaf25 TaxID=1735692 RepID=UPI0006FB896C|nr:hypothetical protein [Sphingomonas sp. Leaf25]KQM98840.1 hypothetical protein ASE78_06385 [Sphingomonas sp. Leaf25]
MTDNTLPTPTDLGFRRVARFGVRSDLANAGRKLVEGSDGNRIAYLVQADRDSIALFDGKGAATYMWIEAGALRPCYVGMANGGMRKRAVEHERGFHGTLKDQAEHERRRIAGDPCAATAGLGHADRIRAMWESNSRRELELWVRPAERVEIFGAEVSLAATEEARLIALFCPPWNREHKPRQAKGIQHALPKP